MLSQATLFKENLPKRPYCADDLGYGLQIRGAATALTRRHIQPNSPWSVKWLVMDLDTPLYWALMENQFLPAPNLVSFNPENNHAHLFYSLIVPVYKCQAARHKPLRYLAAVEYALCEKWGADSAYSGLISKNPLHPSWETIQPRAESWELGELADCLTLPNKLPKRATLTGLGRNCTLFDLLRFWAYDNVLEYRISAGVEAWRDSVLKAAQGFNTFPEPLPPSEVAATAKSVANWVWRSYTRRWSNEQFAQIQAQRGKWGGIAKGKANAEKRAKAHELRAKGMTQQAIAKELGVHRNSISNWLKS